jgi:hypothetical protein
MGVYKFEKSEVVSGAMDGKASYGHSAFRKKGRFQKKNHGGE